MNNKKLIAEALLEISKERSETTFIDVAEDKELIEAAQKIGIVLPSPDFLVMKTIYAEIDKVNRNGVILPRKAVEKGLPTLIGKNCNWEHEGSGRICGYTISAKINEDKIETINVLFKSLFPDEIVELREKVESKDAAVSFEIWNANEKGESVLRHLDDGTKEITEIIFHGTGVLLSNPPACPKAKIFKVIGSKEIENKVFEENLICASMAVEIPKCTKCTTCTCDTKGGIEVEIPKEIENLVIQNAELAVTALATIVTEKAEEVLCPECHQPMKEDETELCAVCKTKKDEKHTSTEETKAEVIAPAAETKTEEVAVEMKVEEVVVEEKAEEAAVTSTTQLVTEVVTTVDNTTVVETDSIVIREAVSDDGSKSTEIQETKQVNTYTFEQVQEEVAKVKAELEQKLLEKDNELASLKELIEKTKVEKETEIANLKTELEATKKPIEIAKVEATELTVGNVTEVATEDKYVALRKNIDIKAFGKKG